LQVNTSRKNNDNSALVLLRATKTVFTTNWIYTSIAIVVTAIFWILFNSFDQLLFFSPLLVFYLPKDAVVDFVASNIAAALLGIVVSMNVYALRQRRSLNNQGKKIGTTTLFSGSSLSILSTVCASCSSSLGFILMSIFGTGLGVTVSAFLSSYQTPLHIVSVVILLWSWYSISKSLSTKGYCTVSSNRNPTNNDN
jgi:hypothetical protein